MKRPLKFSILYSFFLFSLLVAAAFIAYKNSLSFLIVNILWSAFVAYLGFGICRSGKIYIYRFFLFVLIAFLFFLEFKLFRFIGKGSPLPPYCHIAQSPNLFNFIHSQYLALTSGNYEAWGVLTLGFLWLLIIFTIGQGVCSWVCFYGGIDELFSKILPRPLLKLNIGNKWRDFPVAFLVFLLIVSFMQGMAIFCIWFCPFKMTESFWDSQAAIRTMQAAIFIFVLAIFLVILPILTKKRMFCSLICPFGALASIAAKFTPYRVIIDKAKCTLCGRCKDICPVFAVEKDKTAAYKISNYCNRCGRCVDLCPAAAIDICAFNRKAFIDKIGLKIQDIFIFLSLLLSGAISGLFVPDAVLRLWHLIFR